uniref:Uncharacterized protein n=1 Tax=Arundo donax TaxID=35708 RepID=A0A0A9D920_ARUDO
MISLFAGFAVAIFMFYTVTPFILKVKNLQHVIDETSSTSRKQKKLKAPKVVMSYLNNISIKEKFFQ